MKPQSFFAVLTLGISHVVAQNITLPSGGISNGGGTSSGGAYSMDGSIGTSSGDSSSNGTYAITGGFFAQYWALQTEGAPHLIIRSVTSNLVQLAWPASVPGWQLQSNAADLNPSAWIDVAIKPARNSTENMVNVSVSSGRKFFRLRKL